jgi:hypothetical protein
MDWQTKMPKESKSSKPSKNNPSEKRPKLIRDSFTIPEAEYNKLDNLKARGLKLEIPIKKSELLRAGLVALERMDDSEFLDIIKSVERLKTGRPKNKK